MEGKTESFEWRFIRNLENIVADREFNQRSLIKAQEGKDVGVVWLMTNPNVLSVSYPDGRVRELKVTKRSSTVGYFSSGSCPILTFSPCDIRMGA